ncbi:MAG: hypothetical protein KatS3mg083_624 [Candidatus Dojkabacteria bacterium]|nr:MAG: hypothetical protein KatS3mg083_624 [Candidatus Dojkabacteria bacterium]
MDCGSDNKFRLIIKNTTCLNLDIAMIRFDFVPEYIVDDCIVEYKKNLRVINRLFRFCGWFGSEPPELVLRGLCFKISRDSVFLPVDSIAVAFLAYYSDSNRFRISMPSNSGMILESKKDVIRCIFDAVCDDIDDADFYFGKYTYKRFFRASIPLSDTTRRILI